MEIPNFHDIRRVANISYRSGSMKSKSTEDIKPTQTDSDSIKISTVGSFQSKLDGYTKQYASVNDSDNAISPSQILHLKTAYSNDNCPVSGVDIAASILTQTLGYEPI